MRRESRIKPKKSASQQRRQGARSVASASGLALILGLVNAAVGASLTISVPTTPLADSNDIAITRSAPFGSQSAQLQLNPVKALIQNSAVGATTVVPGTGQLGGTVTISANELLATAISNSAVQTLSGGTTHSTEDFSIATGQVTQLATGSAITAAVLSSPKTIGFSNGTNTITGNTTQASATVNTSAASVSHDFLAGFDAPTTGSIDIDGKTNPRTLDADANGVIANFQQAVDAGAKTGSGATVQDSGIRVNDTTVAMVPTDTITVSGNQIGAAYQANDASSAYTGTGGDFAGSLAIASLQYDQEVAGASSAATAAVTGSGIAADTGTLPVDGAVTLTQNTLSADSAGNRVDNRLALTGGAIAGANATPAIVAMGFGSNGLHAQLSGADLAVADTQLNLRTRLASSIEDSDISVSGAGGAGAISVTQNRSQASVAGNEANNALAATGTSVDGLSGVIASAQGNYAADIDASNTTTIQVAGPVGAPMAHSGPVVLDHNTVDSLAVGSTAANRLTVSSDTGVTSGANGPAFITRNGQETGSYSAIDAATQGDIVARLDNSGSPSAQVDATISHNTLSSRAQAQVANNTTTIASNSGAYGARIDNQQNIYLGSNTSATTTSDRVGVRLINDGSANPAPSTVVVSDNRLSAQATANGADNQLQSTADTALSATGTTTELYNVQINGGSVTAQSQNSLGLPTLLGVQASGGVAGDTRVLDNSLLASAAGNTAANSATLQAGTQLDVQPLNQWLLDSRQTQGDTGDIEASARGLIGVQATSVAAPLGSEVVIDAASVSGNVLASAASANTATNALSLTGGTVDLAMLSSSRQALSNRQLSNGGVSATSVGSIGAQAIDPASTSNTVSDTVVADNETSAWARGNQSANTWTLSATTAASTQGGGLANSQTSTGAVTAQTASGTGANIQAGNGSAANSVTGTTSVLDNRLQASAIANDGGSGALGGGSNTLSWTAGTSLAANAGPIVANLQDSSGLVQAELSGGDFSIRASGAGAAVSNTITGDTTLAGNQAVAQATGNQVANRLALTAGTDLSMTTGASLTNAQTVSADVTASAHVGVSIRAEGGGTSNIISGNSTVLGNGMDAVASGNRADNALRLSGGSLAAGTGARLTNAQTSSAEVTADDTQGGFAIISQLGAANSGNTLVGDNTVSGNQMNAEAIGNQAGNLIGLTADTALDVGDHTLLSSAQSSTGDVSATSAGVLSLQASSPASGANAAVWGQSGVLDNTFHAQAGQNAVANQIQLQGGALTGDALGIANTQTASGTTSAQVGGVGVVGILAQAGASSGAASLYGDATVTGNVMESIAQANAASNTLAIDTAATSGPLALGLGNQQTSDGASTATTTLQNGLAVYSSEILGDDDSHSVIEGNRVSAQAGGNQADNTLVLMTDTRLAGIGGSGLLSLQDSNAPVTATTAGSVAILSNSPGGSASTVAGDTTVSGNQVLSQAIGNQAQNRYALQAGTDLSSTAAQTLSNTQHALGAVSAST